MTPAIATGRGLRPTLQTSCARDLASFCASELDLVRLLETRNVPGNPARVQIMEQVLEECLTAHQAEVSDACAKALTTAQASVHHENDQIGVLTDTDMEKEAPSTPMDSAVTAPVPPSVQMAPVDTTNLQEEGIEVRVFFINHHAAVANNNGYLRVGGEAAQFAGPHAPASTGTGALTPWLGLLMFPFFALGLYITVVRAMTFFRRRRDVLYQVRSSGASSGHHSNSNEYQSIPTSKLLSMPVTNGPSNAEHHGH